MKIESTAFEAADVMGFVDELRERERRELLGRLERVDERLRGLTGRLAAASGRLGEERWTAQEVLAHMSVLSKFYGVIAYQIASGKMTDFDLVGQVRLRDVAGEVASAEPPERLIEEMARDHARTAAFVSSVAVADLSRRATTGIEGFEISAYEVLRMPLLGHLEAHLEQLESALA